MIPRISYTGDLHLNSTAPSPLVRLSLMTPHKYQPVIQLQKQLQVYLEALDSGAHSFEAFYTDDLKADCMIGQDMRRRVIILDWFPSFIKLYYRYTNNDWLRQLNYIFSVAIIR